MDSSKDESEELADTASSAFSQPPNRPPVQESGKQPMRQPQGFRCRKGKQVAREPSTSAEPKPVSHSLSLSLSLSPPGGIDIRGPSKKRQREATSSSTTTLKVPTSDNVIQRHDQPDSGT